MCSWKPPVLHLPKGYLGPTGTPHNDEGADFEEGEDIPSLSDNPLDVDPRASSPQLVKHRP